MESVLTEPHSMSLSLTSRWGQYVPCSDQCPELTPSSQHTAVGCGATAIAEIMYYWKWPTTGAGSHTDENNYNYRWRADWDEEPLSVNPGIKDLGSRLEWTSANGGRLRMNGCWDAAHYTKAMGISSDAAYLQALATLYDRLTGASTTPYANFGATTYQWDLMRDVHDGSFGAGDNAVATLCYHLAVAVDTYFGILLSTANLSPVPDALADYFRYSNAAADLVNPVNLSSLITENIVYLRPVVLGGVSSTGSPGHAWVLYGYWKGTDPDKRFKMNIAGNGGLDGWYSLDEVPNGYRNIQECIVDIAPEVVKVVGHGLWGNGSPDFPFPSIESAVAAALSGTTPIFKAGSENTFSAPVTIDKALTLKGRNIIIREK
jgi:hypothetical protein